ncbi:cytochrome c oxidase, cbb3-type subunit II [Iodidimonas nitroreducens]|uniref:Cytochrome c oxidase, cbb3-type subunit II n=1 Tax=Iodidimonas nitroreducens TaxID=1236968 RepID=A0A5A7NDU9_9PROT|nr:cytochrome-c oxidase, cbb3-type subunit II [Iodidimonas nitroreducens]GAK33097.1 cbb3-type cytochrome c oxidase subunit II [alpha proteobacterium Q-1]GER05106.1 cytochrome c oxidase, cbb3-type subunit II [Iodidimonas nitroreducens]
MAKFTHKTIEKNSILLLVLTLVVVSIGGLVEIVPLFWIKSTIEKVEGIRPYTPLELAGRNIYIREGCYNCHSQMIRSLRSEVDRYGHYSLAAESMYDHPFQWGSKRTGPDLARLGNKYSDEWHQLHMADPRSVVPESVMPGYPFLARTPLDVEIIEAVLETHALVGVPYDAQMIAHAKADLVAQLQPFGDLDGLYERYGEGIAVRDFDGNPRLISELDALIAYMQMLGTLVDFNVYKAQEADNER